MRYTEKELQIIRDNYAELGGKGTAFLLGLEGFSRLPKAVSQKARKMGLRSTINKGIYHKGKTPWNKGKKTPHINNTNAVKTQFKKGSLPHNTKTNGTISVRRDSKTGTPYQYIRLAKKKWAALHRHVWAQAHGAIPPKQVVRFIDGDTMNCTIENLELISMKENARRNHNRKKFMETAKNPTDKMVAGRLSHNNPELRKHLLTRPDILELARAAKRLNNKIKVKKNERKNGKRAQS